MSDDTELDAILNAYGRWMVDSYTESFKTQQVSGISQTSMKPSEAKAAINRLIEKEVRRALLRLKNQEVIVSNYTSFNGEHRIIFSSEIDAALEAGSGEAV